MLPARPRGVVSRVGSIAAVPADAVRAAPWRHHRTPGIIDAGRVDVTAARCRETADGQCAVGRIFPREHGVRHDRGNDGASRMFRPPSCMTRRARRRRAPRRTARRARWRLYGCRRTASPVGGTRIASGVGPRVDGTWRRRREAPRAGGNVFRAPRPPSLRCGYAPRSRAWRRRSCHRQSCRSGPRW